VKFKSRAVSRFVGEAQQQQQQQRFANQQSEVSAREQKVGLILRVCVRTHNHISRGAKRHMLAALSAADAAATNVCAKI
jgi:hypothetical protein